MHTRSFLKFSKAFIDERLKELTNEELEELQSKIHVLLRERDLENIKGFCNE